MPKEKTITLHILKDSVKEPIDINIRHIKKIQELWEQGTRLYLQKSEDEPQICLDVTETKDEVFNLLNK